jgi:hypothetical protein
MNADSPVRCLVALSGEKIAPILQDEPAPEQHRNLRQPGDADELGQEKEPVPREHREPELVLVNALPKYIAARSKPMALYLEHLTEPTGNRRLVGLLLARSESCIQELVRGASLDH